MFSEQSQLRQSFFTFFQNCHDELLRSPIILFHQLQSKLNTLTQVFVLSGILRMNEYSIQLLRIMNNEEDEFQRVEPLVKIQQRHKNMSHIREKERSKATEQMEEQQEKRNWDFLQANPILPPGKHHIREQPKLKLTVHNKFTRTTFAGTSINLSNKLQGHIKNNRKVSKQKSKVDVQVDDNQEEEQCEQLRLILSSKIQIYRRINNNELNNLGKDRDRALCSVFFDWKKQKIKSQQEPIIEHLAKMFKIQKFRNQNHWLTFDSSFQGANLFLVVQDPRELMPTYELYMQNDINTKGCTQWYYFNVFNKTRGKVRFRIMNFYKPTSLYQKGMKVLVSHDRIEWKRTGTSIRYYKCPQTERAYALQFIHQFDSANKSTYFSYGYPYTYNFNLTNYIEGLFGELKSSKLIQKSNLCLSAMGNPIPMLTITNRAVKEQKQIIYVIGRQHPGETPASFIVEGIINFLLSPSLQAKQLRDRYQFRVVPMVNVDGVISGNYRSNLSGSDVNRQWQFPSKRGQPEIFWLKQQIHSNRKNVALFLDVHAHSRKMNSFFYGSKAIQKDSKLYPFVCSKLNKFISYSESSFTDDPSKRTTARMILENEAQVPISLTFQCSFYGWIDPNKGTICSFKQNDMRSIGQSLAMGFYYSCIGVQKAKKMEENNIFKTNSEKEKQLMKNSVKMLEKWNKQLEKQSLEEKGEQIYSQGSSLDPQHFQLKQQERQFIAEITRIQAEKASLALPIQRTFSTPKREERQKEKRMIIYSTLSPPQVNDSKLLSPRNQLNNSDSLGISMNEFGQISTARTKNKKKPFSVRQLELQLQYNGELSPQRRLRGVKLKMQDPMAQFSRYQSLDMNRGIKNYKQDVLEMKRALKYLLESKSSDYEQYKSCFKSINNQYMSTTLKSDRRGYK